MIGAPSYDNAVAFLRKGENDIPLDLKKHIVHGNRVIFRTDLDLMIYREAPLVGLLLVHTCKLVKWNLLFFAGHFDQFLVIKGITKLIGQRFSDHTAAASIHTVNGNNVFTHMKSSLLKLSLYLS